LAASFSAIPFAVAPYRLSGAVYGTLLNHVSAVAALGASITAAPYNAAPRAPVLFIKPRNTLAMTGERIEIPAGVDELEVNATLGLVIGRTACRVAVADALEYVAGVVLVNDVSVPHDTFYRPSIRFKARDGFCPLGPRVLARGECGDPAALTIRTHIDGVLEQSMSTADLIRSPAHLLAEVTEFMTLSPGDVLTVGAARPCPLVRAGQTVTIEMAGLGVLANPFAAAVS
jgi:5-oxopent-3-ene-1,2,5-tricarboxylate decarboxylase/2-hydroxyhepta-2,4-diene-1,7-dioate isomerase